ncbi:MAG: hypothetical protein RL320_1695 [Pseudomonadota bacterium]|jgi:hypothetical protein
MTRAYLINPQDQTIQAVQLEQGLESIRSLIGQKSVDRDEIGQEGDHLYFDEACFIRATPDSKRFKLDTLPPVAGFGVVARTLPDGTFTDASVTLDSLLGRVRFS